MFPDLDWAEALAIAIAAFVAGLIRGYSGFGAALAMVPVLAAVVGPVLAVPAVVVVNFFTGVQLIPGAFRDADWERVWPLSIGGMIGVPLGAWLLVSLDPELLRRGISVLIIIFGLLMLRGWRYTGSLNLPLTAGVGGLGGVISGASTIGGPPVVMFLLAGPHRAAQNRAAIIFYFQISQIVALVSYWIGGLLVWTILWLCVLIAPSMMAGMWLGERLFRRTSEELFRRVALIFLIVIGGATLFV